MGVLKIDYYNNKTFHFFKGDILIFDANIKNCFPRNDLNIIVCKYMNYYYISNVLRYWFYLNYHFIYHFNISCLVPVI